ncbi:MAG: DUF1844 domain-containing protein [Deltaproteobacteria bacterium]|nr:DUF1844 domain-containing protein [Deltaproteobacteria bacterium]
MAGHEGGQDKGFKIVDKRRFTAEGETRADAPEDKPRAAARPPEPRPAETKAPAQKPEPRASDPRRAAPAAGQPQYRIDFLSFVASLATNALAALGALPQGQARGIPTDPELAREFIEILGMLRDKTHGNLTPQESAGLERVLADLQLQYVEVSRAAGKPRRP